MLKTKDGVQHIYFPGLNGLRFIAAFLVIVAHIEQTKFIFGYKNIWKHPFINSVGGLSVSLFFVLSGFLITYLLLAEKKNFGNISVRQFYIRRILRIWPLYYLIIALGLFLLPKISLFAVAPGNPDNINVKSVIPYFLYLLLLPNIAVILYPGFLYCSHTWSIGVEEQFYLIWPIILKFTKNYFLTFATIILFFIGALNILYYVSFHFKDMISSKAVLAVLGFLIDLFSSLRIGCMAIGAMGAWVLFSRKEKILRIIYSRWTQIMVFVITILFLSFGVSPKYIHHEFYSVLFCVLILNAASNSNSLLKLENKAFNSLGRISYGLYMYHRLAIVISLAILRNGFNAKFSGFIGNFSLYSLSLFFAIGLSLLSYYLFESKFLKLKDSFSRVISGR